MEKDERIAFQKGGKKKVKLNKYPCRASLYTYNGVRQMFVCASPRKSSWNAERGKQPNGSDCGGGGASSKWLMARKMKKN